MSLFFPENSRNCQSHSFFEGAVTGKRIYLLLDVKVPSKVSWIAMRKEFFVDSDEFCFRELPGWTIFHEPCLYYIFVGTKWNKPLIL